MALAILLSLLLLAVLGAPWLLLLVDAPIWAPLAIDTGVLSCVAAVALARWLVHRTKLNAIALPPTKPARDAMRADQAAELEEIRRELDAALGTLARSRLAGGGRGALRALPWYAIVGAPASGKSALVRGSGLSFPNAAQGRDARGVGSTKRCDVWLGNEAVLLDTAGRWSVSEDDTEWCTFLERLRKHRSERALDGLLLTVALDGLLSSSESERAALARHLRARIEAVSSRLDVAVPVYLVVTKCDRLVGFSESFAGLDKRDRARPWGFTLESATSGLEEPVRAELERLVRTLRARVASTLANERRIEARAFVAELPAHFQSVLDPLATLVSQIFVASVYGETPTLRGIYFTSATQEGRPVDALLGGSLRQNGIGAPPLAEPTLEPRSYFVHQVLTRIVFADAETAAPSTRAKRRRNLLHLSTGIAAASVACALVIASAFSWQANRRAIDDLSEAVHQLPRERTLASPSALDALRAQLGSIDGEVRDGAPFSMRLGLYGGPHLREVARARYLAALRDRVLAPLLSAEATELETWGTAYESELDREPSDAERTRALALLDRALRFASPREPGEPPLDARGRSRLARSLAEAWCTARERPVAECEAHAALLFETTDTADRPRVERRDAAIRLARLGLARTHADRAALDALVASAAGRGYDLTLARMVGTTGRALTSELHVRGAFTRRGWEEVVRAEIDAADGDADRAWAMGDAATHSTPASREALRGAYFAAYVEEWRAFLSSVRISPATDATASLALLEDLTRGTPPPIGRLLVAVDDNAHLGEAPESVAGVATSGLLDSLATHLTSGRPELAALHPAADPSGAALVTRALEPYTHFAVRGEGMPEDAPLGIDVYGDELALLRDALATYRDDPTAAAPLEARLVAARRRVDGLVTEQSPGARDFFERVLRPPVEAAAVTSSRAMAGAVANAFCAAVVTPFAASLSGRYPFASRGDDAALGEVTAFYRPGGTLWSYYDASLVTIVPRAGARFTLARRLDQGSASPYTSQLPTFLDRSQAITNGLFPPGSSEPRIELDIRVHPTAGAASVRFSVGGATIDYRNGPESWSRVVWPGATPSAGARLEVESARGLSERITEDGEWGLFRLVELPRRSTGDRASERAPPAGICPATTWTS